MIVASEIAELQAYGVERIYSPEDGQRMGLAGMIRDMIERCDVDLSTFAPTSLDGVVAGDRRQLAQLITALENRRGRPESPAPVDDAFAALRDQVYRAADRTTVPTLGITGTGGAGKSSLTDELIRRIRLDQDDALDIAVISIDPSRRKSGGALLGDRIRMNAIGPWKRPDASSSTPPKASVSCARSRRARPARRSATRCRT